VTSRDIIHAISRDLWQPHRLEVAYNTPGVLGWEADMLVLSKAGYLDEIEIKVSVSDFRAEFKAKAHKHEMLIKGIAPIFWRDNQGRSYADEGFDWKSPQMYYRWEQAKPHAVRRFLFAIPEELESKLAPEIPHYAGLITVNRWAHVVKKAPVLKQSRRITEHERAMLLRAMYHRGWQRFRDNHRTQEQSA